MTVGKPDFNLNSFGIQYKEKTVKYTEDVKELIKTKLEYPDLPEKKGYEGSDRSSITGELIHDPARKKRTMKEIDNTIEAGKVKEIETATLNASKLIKTADETIFKSISLKLDLMKTTGKNQGDVNQQVKEGDDREVFTNIEGNNAHQNPPPVGGGGFAGKGRRRMINGEKKIVAQTSEETVPKVNDIPTSKLNDVVDAKDVTSKKVTNAQQMITDNPTTSSGEGTIDPAIASGNSGKVSTWNDGLPATGNSAIGGSVSETAATETSAEDTENAANNAAGTAFRNSKMGKDQAARRAKREAAILARGGTVNNAVSEINAMTDGMKELMKDIKPRDYSHGKCVNCGKKMNHQEHMAADHSFNNPKEGEKVCSDCFDKEQ